MEHTHQVPHKGRPRTFVKEEVLFKALKVFWHFGYANTSVSMLCKALNLSAPSLYAAFGSKSALFIKTVDFYEDTYWEPLREQFRKEADFYKAFYDFFLGAVKVMTLDGQSLGCMVTLTTLEGEICESEVVEKVTNLELRVEKLFYDKLLTAKEHGQIKAHSDPKILANFLSTFFNGLTLRARLGQSAQVLEEAVNITLKLVESEVK